MTCVLQMLGLGPEAAEAVAVRSLTFGGTIRAAGLLTVGDYLAAYEAWRRANAEPGQILTPVESFNSLGFDLTHRHVSELERLTGRPVVLV